MKKRHLLCTALIVLGLASCKKANQVCQCTYPDGSVDSYVIVDKVTKKTARFDCEGTDNIKYTTDGEHYITDKKDCKLEK